MKALVTGGGGFLGTRIVQMLSARGDEPVVFSRHRYPHHEEAGVRTMQGDLRDPEAVDRACEGMDVVFHVGALAGIWGPRKTFQEINVSGTRHVLQSCRSHGIRRLVYTSSPSVVFGDEELCGVDESQPYPRRHLAYYPETKAEAERMILGANGDTLATVALRPHLIWGPGDPHLLPRVVARARAGRLVQVGDGKNLVDITFIDNAAEAHLLAADALKPTARCAGRAYFVSQGEPVKLWPWLNDILAAAAAPPITRAISFRKARGIGAAFEAVYRTFGIRSEPPMTRFVAAQLAKSHYFDISAACKDLGYAPRVSITEGLPPTIAYLVGESATDGIAPPTGRW